jgi:hypothetical protein
VFASDGNTQDHEPLIKSFGLEDFDYVLSTEVGNELPGGEATLQLPVGYRGRGRGPWFD